MLLIWNFFGFQSAHMGALEEGRHPLPSVGRVFNPAALSLPPTAPPLRPPSAFATDSSPPYSFANAVQLPSKLFLTA